MRLIRKQMYSMGVKVPYFEWPEIIHSFLQEQGLTSHRFLYYFKDLTMPAEWQSRYGHGCERLAKALPEIGTPREYNPDDESCHDIFLSNIDIETGCSEQQILPLMKKISRSYGLIESDLYYLDVDFFSEVIPTERSFKQAEEFCLQSKKVFDPLRFLTEQPVGSGFRLHRYETGGNFISLSIDILRNGVVIDASPVFEAFRKKLPKVPCSDHLNIYTTKNEEEVFAQHNAMATSTINSCRKWFAERLPGLGQQNNFASDYKLANKLKALAMQYDWKYKYHGIGIFTLDFKTANGHFLRMDIDSGPSHYETGFYLIFQGLGFEHRLHSATFTPTSQQEFDAVAEHVCETMFMFQTEMLPNLDTCWPQTPDWFIPNL